MKERSAVTGMKLAFVVRLGKATQPADNFFEGWVEEVDSCTELRFRSTGELLKFLGQRFDLTMAATSQDAAADTKQSPVHKANRIARAVRLRPKSGSDL
jgi:hypothetical protein